MIRQHLVDDEPLDFAFRYRRADFIFLLLTFGIWNFMGDVFQCSVTKRVHTDHIKSAQCKQTNFSVQLQLLFANYLLWKFLVVVFFSLQFVNVILLRTDEFDNDKTETLFTVEKFSSSISSQFAKWWSCRSLHLFSLQFINQFKGFPILNRILVLLQQQSVPFISSETRNGKELNQR